MKGSLLGKFTYVFCALAGILAGYGVFSLAGAQTEHQNSITKDSTLIREAGDSVFFDVQNEVMSDTEAAEKGTDMVTSPTLVPLPALTEAPATTETLVPTEVPVQTMIPTPTAFPTQIPAQKEMPEQRADSQQTEPQIVPMEEAVLPSLGSHWVTAGITVTPSTEPTEATEQETGAENSGQEKEQDTVEEVITYPAKIFGQTPVINRSDTYVSYFEFCYDLVAMMEAEVAARGLNINTLMTKFALKALFCGVDIEKLDINAPIPRRLAALCLWLAAQVLNEDGCETSSKSAGTYVTDISSCSSSERKAIAYLYEQRVVKGYQVAGQKFYPADGLKTKTGEAWLLEVKKSWK